MMMLNFVLFGGCGYLRALSRVNRFKKIKAPSKGKQSVIYMYDQSGTFSLCFPSLLSFLFLQGLINLKNYDHRLYVNVEDLAV